MLSFVIPAYNEEKNIQNTATTVSRIMRREGIDCEIVFVNDGSKDATWNRIQEAVQTDSCVIGVNLSRNFGKEAALLAGLESANGDCVVVMDCDLQHPPETVVEMYRLWEQGYMIVEGIKRSRGQEGKMHAFAAKMFYNMMSAAIKIDMQRASDFKLMDRKVVDVLLSFPEHNSFFRALSSWVGYKSTTVEFDVQERLEGESKWSTKALFRYAVNNITSFSAAPLQLVTVVGIITVVCAFILIIQTLVNYCMGNAVAGFTTVILLQLIIGSINLLGLGLMGYYMSKMYDELKGRPKFLISEVLRGSNLKKQRE